MTTYKEQFFKKRKKDLIEQYKALRKEKKTRDEALKILEPIFELTPESMKVVMSNKNYIRNPLGRKKYKKPCQL